MREPAAGRRYRSTGSRRADVGGKLRIPLGAAPGVRLGLARGFAEALGDALGAEDTPGGGLAMVLGVPTAPQRRPGHPDLPTAAAS